MITDHHTRASEGACWLLLNVGEMLKAAYFGRESTMSGAKMLANNRLFIGQLPWIMSCLKNTGSQIITVIIIMKFDVQRNY